MMKKTIVSIISSFFVIVAGVGFFSSGDCFAACPDNITGYWKLDKDAPGGGYKDEVKGYTGTGIGDLDTTTGVVENAAVFNANNTGIWIPPHSIHGWYGQESFSIEFWVKKGQAPAATNPQVIIGRNDPSSGMQWWVGVEGLTGKASFWIQDGSGNSVNGVGIGKSITDGKWHHVALVRDGKSDSNSFFVDGAIQGGSMQMAFPQGFNSEVATLDIGYLNLSPFFRFAGAIDEVALYNRALSQSEIQEHVEAGNNGIDYCAGDAPSSAPFPDDTVSVWHLDEAGGDTYVDAFGENDGIGNNSPTPLPNGRVEGAQGFGGGNANGISVAPSSGFGWYGNESFSIECWVKTAAQLSPPVPFVVVGRYDDATTMSWWIGAAEGTGAASFYLQDGSGAVGNLVGVGKSITDGEWHHVMAVRDSNTNDNTLYVDGAVQGGSVNAAFPQGFGSQTATLDIGYLNQGSFFRFGGAIDEVALYGRALPQSEIIEHVEAGNAGRGVDNLNPALFTVDAGPDQTVAKNTRVDLTGSVTPSYEGQVINTYQWTQTAGTQVDDLTDADSLNAYFTAPDLAAEEILTFQLTATADDGQSNSDSVDVTVSGTDTAPSGDDGGSSGCFISTLF